MKYYLIAGEASGDLHGAGLMRGLAAEDPGAQFRFWGGDRMAAVGGVDNLARHYSTTSFYGIVNVAAHAGEIVRQLSECKADVAAFDPDVLILIDYPGFNFRMARWARDRGITVFWYIAPKVWAWRESRVRLLKKYVDRLFVIFPFEVEYFKDRGVDAIYEGCPLVDVIEEQRAAIPTRSKFLKRNSLPADKPLVALLPGSRRGEVRHNLPFMAELARRMPDRTFVVGAVSWLEKELYDRVIGTGGVRVVFDQTYALLAHAEAAVITSGTATLESALTGTPEVVCWRGDRLSTKIGRMTLTVRWLSLVNLIMGREVVHELIQWDMTMQKAEAELRALLPGGAKRRQMLVDFKALRETLGGPGAPERTARQMVRILKMKGY